MTFISYAQNFEDVMLWRALKHIDHGFYIDIGAQDPVIDSVSLAFYEHGWRGIHIEPTRQYSTKLREARPDEIVEQVAIASSEGLLKFYEFNDTGLSTADPEIAKRHQSAGFLAVVTEVPIASLDSILNRYIHMPVHWLKIDVEGLERNVLESWRSSSTRPWVLVIESTAPLTQVQCNVEWESLVLDKGYICAYFDGLNNFYVHRDHHELLASFNTPPNIFDAFVLSRSSSQPFYALIATKAEQAEAKAEQAEAKAEQAEAKAEQVEDRVYELNRELKSIYTSKSWRITLPMRKAMLLISNRNLVLRRIFRGGLLFTLSMVRGVPPLNMLVKHWIAKFPTINSHLRAFASNHQSSQTRSPEAIRLAGVVAQKVFHHAQPKGQRIIYYYVDHTVGCSVNTGIQRVVRGLARSFLEGGERLFFVKWHFDQRQLVLINRNELANLSQWQGPEVRGDEMSSYPEASSPSIAIPRQQIGTANWLIVPEVTHINNHPAAVTLDVIMAAKQLGLKSAFVFYDATPMRRKELVDMAPKHEEYMQQLLLADLVVPISEWSASDLAAFFTNHELATQVTIPKIVVIPLTGESQLTSRVTAPSHTTRKLILSVGSITPHKNQLTLVRAFEAFVLSHPESDWELALVGNIHHDLFDELSSIKTRIPAIKVMNHLSDGELNRQLNECAFTVFPSVMEGFGLPILESLWYGKPCICADFGAMAEVAKGGGCLMTDVRDSDAILAAIEQLVFEPTTILQLQAEALERPLSSWRNYGNDFSEALDQVFAPLNQIGVVYYWVDHTCAYHSNSGIQRVVRGMARAMMEIGVSLIPIKWDRTTQNFTSLSKKELMHLSQWNGPSIESWAPWQHPKNSSIFDWLLIPELLSDPLGPSNFTIKRYAAEHHLRTSCVFYDAIPWKMTTVYTQGEAQRHGEYMRGLNEFELILSISEFSRSDLIRFLQGLVNDKTLNLEDRMLTCELPGEFKESKRILQVHPYQPDAPIRILCVCTVEPRKNHLTLLKAFKQLVSETNKKVELCLVGGALFPELTEQIQREIKANSDIRWERNVDDAQLRELYDECDFTVYPSLEEGFGLPILESLWHARPCICRDTGAMAEVGTGGGCLMVETADVASLAAAMLQLVSDFNLRDQLAKEAVERPFRTWKDYANDVVMMMANERQLSYLKAMPKR